MIPARWRAVAVLTAAALMVPLAPAAPARAAPVPCPKPAVPPPAGRPARPTPPKDDPVLRAVGGDSLATVKIEGGCAETLVPLLDALRT